MGGRRDCTYFTYSGEAWTYFDIQLVTSGLATHSDVYYRKTGCCCTIVRSASTSLIQILGTKKFFVGAWKTQLPPTQVGSRLQPWFVCLNTAPLWLEDLDGTTVHKAQSGPNGVRHRVR
jgi:hypothetical protein